MLRHWGLFLIALLGALWLGLIAIMPPAVKPVDAPPETFSAMRAMEDVRIISAKPHPTGSEENAKVRTYITQRLESLGADVVTTQSPLNERALARHNRRNKSAVKTLNIYNVIGTFPGTDPSKPALLLMVHHDTVPGSPGAADDTIGVASIFEIIRALNVDKPYERPLIVLMTDAEELGLIGAKQFFKNNALSDSVGAIINFEARGGGGTANMFQTSTRNGNLARLYADVVKQPSTSSLSIFVYNALPNDTDLTPALERDYAAYNIANIGDAKYYHSPEITPDALDPRTLQHMGSQGLDLARALLASDPFPSQAPDATFFDAYGLFTVIYPAFWGWLFIVFGGIAYAVAGRSKGAQSLITTAKSGLNMLCYLGLGAGFLFAFNWLSGGGAGSNYYDRLAAIPKLEFMTLATTIGLFFLIFGRADQESNRSAGPALSLFLIAIAGQFVAPTASYFLTLPLLMAGGAAWLSARWPETAPSRATQVLLAALIAGYMLYLGHQLMLGVGPDVPSIAILPAALAVLTLVPLFPQQPSRRSLYIGLALIFLAILTALWVRFDPVAITVPNW